MSPEELAQKILTRSGGQFLYVSFLVERIRDRPHLADALLNSDDSPERLYADFLNGLGEVFPTTKMLHDAWWALAGLAAWERAHDWSLDAFEGLEREESGAPLLVTDGDWRGVGLKLLAASLGRVKPALIALTGGSVRQDDESYEAAFVLALFRLKAALGIWRGGATADSSYRLWLKGMAQQVAAHERLGPLMRRAHHMIAEHGLDRARSRADGGARLDSDLDLFSLTLAHTHLSGSPELRTALDEDREQPLVSRLIQEAAFCSEQSRYKDAVRAGDIVLALLAARSRSQGARQLTSAEVYYLAQALSERANAKLHMGDLSGSCADYDRVAVMLEEAANHQIEQLDFLIHDLAVALIGRGSARVQMGETALALADYDRAATVLTQLREKLGPRFDPLWENNLALAFVGRAGARMDFALWSDALADYDAAIAIQNAMEGTFGASLPVSWKTGRLGATLSRAGARLESGDAQGALADFSAAIDFGERGKGETLPALGKHELAAAYMSRASTHALLGDPAAARADFNQAVSLFSDLRRGMTDAFPAMWENNFAVALVGRAGVATKTNAAAALGDYDEAIAKWIELKTSLGQIAFPDAWEALLATARRSRGLLRAAWGDVTGALHDIDLAIATLEALSPPVNEAAAARRSADIAELRALRSTLTARPT